MCGLYTVGCSCRGPCHISAAACLAISRCCRVLLAPGCGLCQKQRQIRGGTVTQQSVQFVARMQAVGTHSMPSHACFVNPRSYCQGLSTTAPMLIWMPAVACTRHTASSSLHFDKGIVAGAADFALQQYKQRGENASGCHLQLPTCACFWRLT